MKILTSCLDIDCSDYLELEQIEVTIELEQDGERISRTGAGFWKEKWKCSRTEEGSLELELERERTNRTGGGRMKDQ